MPSATAKLPLTFASTALLIASEQKQAHILHSEREARCQHRSPTTLESEILHDTLDKQKAIASNVDRIYPYSLVARSIDGQALPGPW
jgi:hypothetical protein